jgi:hypothetical protein
MWHLQKYQLTNYRGKRFVVHGTINLNYLIKALIKYYKILAFSLNLCGLKIIFSLFGVGKPCNFYYQIY